MPFQNVDGNAIHIFSLKSSFFSKIIFSLDHSVSKHFCVLILIGMQLELVLYVDDIVVKVFLVKCQSRFSNLRNSMSE